MCTEVEEGMVSGMQGVEWDAVELPSQFMVRVLGLASLNIVIVYIYTGIYMCVCVYGTRWSCPLSSWCACSCLAPLKIVVV